MKDSKETFTANCEKTLCLVEADSFAIMALWERYCEKSLIIHPRTKPVKWEEAKITFTFEIGKIGDLPVVSCMSFHKLNGHTVAFYGWTSRAVDTEMVKEWADRCCPNKIVHCDAMNFHQCISQLEKLAIVQDVHNT